MSCVVLKSKYSFCFACDTVEKPFGPLLNMPQEFWADADKYITEFRKFMKVDERTLSDDKISKGWGKFMKKKGIKV